MMHSNSCGSAQELSVQLAAQKEQVQHRLAANVQDTQRLRQACPVGQGTLGKRWWRIGSVWCGMDLYVVRCSCNFSIVPGGGLYEKVPRKGACLVPVCFCHM